MTRPLRLALLDRDGTLIASPERGRYLLDPDRVRLLPGAAEAVGRLNRSGIPVAVVTNQRAIALGLITAAGVEAIHERINRVLAEHGAFIDAWFVCPHDEGECECRKPKPGLVQEALDRFVVPGADAVIIGDARSDMLAGAALGLRGVRLGPSDGLDTSWQSAGSLLEAVDLTLAG